MKIELCLFIFVSKLLWCERDRQMEGDKYSLLYWPITASLDRTMLCYHLALMLFSQEVLNQSLAGAPKTDSRLSLTLPVSHVGICIYHFITHTHISIQPCDCFHLFSQVRPVQRISDWQLGQGSVCNNQCLHGIRNRGVYFCVYWINLAHAILSSQPAVFCHDPTFQFPYGGINNNIFLCT